MSSYPKANTSAATCPPKCTLCSWNLEHTPEDGHALKRDEDSLTEDQIYESVLLNERLALLLLHDQTPTVLATLSPGHQANHPLKLHLVLAIGAGNAAKQRRYNEQINSLFTRIETAPPKKLGCLQQELRAYLSSALRPR
ncbi:uncharacterized protein LY89DRAFT_375029 [Mollisia scopiformis]|uniref:Uncharacterized protein n=1 Tax=Mollisia scopiformis TaxID=149040 RepID=A0A132B3N9_MOLSC|nr:uncharacterized protein LY89DRAFT_375029 [Mollisia scopiformis]KUJ07002.1 hypothetical protein LY89DRAFT_375029 [Mollisia scopiformis]